MSELKQKIFDFPSRVIKIFLQKFDELIGIKHIKLIHLNDSERKLGSMIDRHANIGFGHIGKKSLACVAKFFIKHNIPIILEAKISEYFGIKGIC